MGLILFFCWYYPIGFTNSIVSDLHERTALICLLCIMFLLWTSTFSHLAIVAVETAELAGIPANLVWLLCLSFCGVGVTSADLPRFWSFMYRISPATYLIGGMLGSAMHGSNVTCSPMEILHLPVPQNVTCEDFLSPFATATGGTILNPSAMSGMCKYCFISKSDQILERFNIYYDERWRNYGLLWTFVVANVLGALGLYWLVRVPKGGKKQKS